MERLVEPRGLVDGGCLNHRYVDMESSVMAELSPEELRAVEQRIHDEIPISSYMGLKLGEFTGEQLIASVDFEKNKNIHGTAFGGSLYSAAALTGWAL